MSNYEFWIELGNIYKAVNAYQQKAIEFNKRFIFPWIRLGNIFGSQSRSEEAIRAYQKAIELDPQNAYVWNEIGNVYLNSGEYDQAVDAYQKAMECDPESGWPYSNLALTYFRQAKYAEAIPLFKKSIELFKDSQSKAASWNRLGNTYRRLGDDVNAIAAYRMADQLNPNSSALRSDSGNVDEQPGAIEEIGVGETTDMETPVASPLAADLQSMNNGGDVVPEAEEPELQAESSDAVTAMQNACPAAEEETIMPAPEVGVPAEAQSTPSLAEDTAGPAIETVVAETQEIPVESVEEPLAGSMAEALVAEAQEIPVESAEEPSAGPMAEVLVAEAQETPVESVEEPSAGPMTEVLVAKEQEESIRSVEEPMSGQAVEIVVDTAVQCTPPPDVDVPAEAIQQELPPIASKVDQSQAGEADSPVAAILNADSKNAHVWNELGNIYISIGAYDAAIDAYHKAIELDPEFGWPYSNLALTFFSQGKYAEAIPLYRKSIELLGSDKEKATSWNRLGNAFRSMDNVENAARAYRKAADLDPENKAFQDSASKLPVVPANPVMEPAQSGEQEPEESVTIEQAVPAAPEEALVMVEVEAQKTADVAEPNVDPVIALETPAVVEPESAWMDMTAPKSTGMSEENIAFVAGWDFVRELPADKEKAEEHAEAGVEAPGMDAEPDDEMHDEAEATTADAGIVAEEAGEAASEDNTLTLKDALDKISQESGEEDVFTSIDCQSAREWYDLGRDYLNKGRFDDAVFAYKKAIKSDPLFGLPYGSLASIYLRQGDYAEAIPLYQRSIELLESDTEKAVSWNKLGHAYRRLGDYDKAISAYHMADELDPKNTRLPAQNPRASVGNNFVKYGTSPVG